MLIGNKYRVTTDSMNFILARRKEHKEDKDEEREGDNEWTVIGYYGTLAGLLESMVDYDLKGMGLEDLKAVALRQAGLYFLIKSLDLPELRHSHAGGTKGEGA